MSNRNTPELAAARADRAARTTDKGAAMAGAAGKVLEVLTSDERKRIEMVSDPAIRRARIASIKGTIGGLGNRVSKRALRRELAALQYIEADAAYLRVVEEALANLISVVEQLIPEPSARGVADVVLFQARSALAAKGGTP